MATGTKAIIDIAKLAISFIVVAIHANLAGNNLELHTFFNLLVPLFFIFSGYLMYPRLVAEGEAYLNKSIKKYAHQYIIWSIIYLPLTIYGCTILYNTTWEAIYTTLFRYIIIGSQYMSWILWYIWALIIALLLLRFLVFKCNLTFTPILWIAIFIIGIGILLETTKEYGISQIYFRFFRTTLNGLFVGFPYIIGGMALAKRNSDSHTLFTKHKYATAAIATLLMISLCFLQTDLARLLNIIPLLYIFAVLLNTKTNVREEVSTYCRNLSTWIFYTHLIWIFTFEKFTELSNWGVWGLSCMVCMVTWPIYLLVQNIAVPLKSKSVL